MLKNALIYYIDDLLPNLKLVKALLNSYGYKNVVVIDDPCKVLDLYKANRPDLILLDVNMPVMDGYQVLGQLRGLNDPLLPPIVMMTANDGLEHREKALSAGARDYITKPFASSELRLRVQNLLEAQLAFRLLNDQKAVLEEMVAERTEAVNRSYSQALQCLARAASYRDNDTGIHTQRMSEYSVVIARSLGWSEANCKLLLLAAPMHDIGKIGIPDAILKKTGKLDAEEWVLMQTHSQIGADILADVDSELLEMARVISSSHHEKWDGTGYPNGLAGQAIPEVARVVAVADVFDALTSERPYKNAWSDDEALDYIIENAGDHFDPDIVSHFVCIFSKILAIKEFFNAASETIELNNV